MSKPASQIMGSEDIQTKVSADDSAIRLLAFQIHIAYGGSDIENWLEAEEIFRNDDQSFLN
jgi:hypothetical protein